MSNIAVKDSLTFDKGMAGSKVKDLSDSSGVSEEDIRISVRTMDESKKLFREDLSGQLETQEGKKAFSEVVDVANKIFFAADSHFQFEVHDKTGRVMVKVINNDTEKVIKELPPEKLLNAVAGIWELAGIIVDEKA